MSVKDTPGAQGPVAESASDGDGRDDHSLASKLSKELSNWRQQRNASRARRPENLGTSNIQPEPARTIRVRGHETLVVRKPKLAPKAPASPRPESN